MVYLSDHEDLILGDNYTRGMISDLLQIKYPRDEIERGIYKPKNCSSVLLFSTIQNPWGHSYTRISDTELVSNCFSLGVLTSYQMDNEILLFIRTNYETGFYYFGKCQPTKQYFDQNGFPYSGLRLVETKFSTIRGIVIPETAKQGGLLRHYK